MEILKYGTYSDIFLACMKLSDEEVQTLFNKYPGFLFSESVNAKSIQYFAEYMVKSQLLMNQIKHSIYHVTPMKNYNKILKNGFIPKIGKRSKELGETIPAVYFFPSREDCDTALSCWLGECFEDVNELVIFEVLLPANARVHSDVEYELCCFDIISPSCITSCYAEDWEKFNI